MIFEHLVHRKFDQTPANVFCLFPFLRRSMFLAVLVVTNHGRNWIIRLADYLDAQAHNWCTSTVYFLALADYFAMVIHYCVSYGANILQWYTSAVYFVAIADYFAMVIHYCRHSFIICFFIWMHWTLKIFPKAFKDQFSAFLE